MISGPLISVIMPAYNAAKYIQQSIDSVLSQTYSHWELWIVDDGSTDDTAATVKKVTEKDKRINYVLQNHNGQGVARNNGIRKANGDLIALLDADDTWVANKLEKQVSFIMSTNADLVFSDIIVIGENSSVKRDSWEVGKSSYHGKQGLISFLNGNKIPLPSVLFKKNIFFRVNGFEERLESQYGEDYDLWIRMLQAGATFASTDDKLAAYRQHPAQITRNTKAMIQVVERLKALEFNDDILIKERDRAIRLWIRRLINTTLSGIEKADIKQIIQLLPSFYERYFVSLSNMLLPERITGNVILLFCRRAINNA